MGIFGDLCGPMGTYGDLWGHLRAYGDLWGPMGTFWGPIGTFGDLWGRMGAYGGLSGALGVYADLSVPLGTSEGLWPFPASIGSISNILHILLYTLQKQHATSDIILYTQSCNSPVTTLFLGLILWPVPMT